MIQRIQSIFLFLASACFFGLFALPLAKSDVAGSYFFSDQIYDVQDHIVLTGLAGLGGLVTLIAIFLYKKRTAQMRLGFLGIISAIFLILVAYLFVANEGDKMGNIEIQEQIGIGLPILAIILIIIANRFIKKDDRLVRSMDRLR